MPRIPDQGPAAVAADVAAILRIRRRAELNTAFPETVRMALIQHLDGAMRALLSQEGEKRAR
jgi:hypothetical protein